MKRFNIPFAIAFAVSVAALAAAYADGESHKATTANYAWYDLLQELNELCRLKHSRSIRYEECARRADAERRHDIAALFAAMSHADAIHCDNCRRAIESLGGRFYTPVTSAVKPRPALEYLRLALRDKDSLRRRRTETTSDRDPDVSNRSISRMLTWCDASDIHQIVILRRKIDRIAAGMAEDAPDISLYSVCPRCGDVTEAGLHAGRCPHCMTDSREFLVFR